ncbi:hypothetical protein [Paenibacillus flagellatus]|uniref:hypothetical protein n=1 Tax=Paenibacillus flagellatus TaxID=2211139 RepID=UPI0011B5D7C1|nr:hypothetical protein [Paenibacillus flagellatus]
MNTLAGLAALPAGFNLQFSEIRIEGTLILPSGIVLQASGNILITGAVHVLAGGADSGNGSPNPGVSIAEAGPFSGGIGLGPLQASQITLPKAAAGGAGSRVLLGGGGEGGGALVLLAGGAIHIGAGALVAANGNDGTNPQLAGAGIAGSGGGAGGIIVMAARGPLTVDGTITANGGRGADGWDGDGGDGEGGGGGGSGGIVHLISVHAPVVAGTLQVNGGTGGGNAPGVTGIVTAGGGGGACGGNGGNGGGTPAPGLPVAASQPGQIGQALQTVTPTPEHLFLIS